MQDILSKILNDVSVARGQFRNFLIDSAGEKTQEVEECLAGYGEAGDKERVQELLDEMLYEFRRDAVIADPCSGYDTGMLRAVFLVGGNKVLDYIEKKDKVTADMLKEGLFPTALLKHITNESIRSLVCRADEHDLQAIASISNDDVSQQLSKAEIERIGCPLPLKDADDAWDRVLHIIMDMQEEGFIELEEEDELIT